MVCMFHGDSVHFVTVFLPVSKRNRDISAAGRPRESIFQVVSEDEASRALVLCLSVKKEIG